MTYTIAVLILKYVVNILNKKPNLKYNLLHIFISAPFSNLSTCNVNGNVYYEGETFNLSPRKTCICKCDSNELFCRENKCVTEYRFIKEIDERCAPVYGNFGNSPSCPSSWLCRMC